MTPWEKNLLTEIEYEIRGAIEGDDGLGVTVCSCMLEEAYKNILKIVKREVKKFGDSIKCEVKFDYKPVGRIVPEFNVEDLYKERGIE